MKTSRAGDGTIKAPHQPKSTSPHHTLVAELSTLLTWWQEQGTDPMTREDLSLNSLRRLQEDAPLVTDEPNTGFFATLSHMTFPAL